MTKNSGIYVFRSLFDGVCYVGQSAALNVRKSNHFSALRNKVHPNKRFQLCYETHGEENIEYSVVEFCEIDVLFEREKFWIEKIGWGNLFNVKDAVKNALFGKKQSKDVIAKRVAKLIGKTRTQEQKDRISKGNTGKRHTEEFKKAISQRMKERVIDDKTKLKMSESAKKRAPISQETKDKISAALIGKKRAKHTKEQSLAKSFRQIGKKHKAHVFSASKTIQ
jgi:group I intron endonuclease